MTLIFFIKNLCFINNFLNLLNINNIKKSIIFTVINNCNNLRLIIAISTIYIIQIMRSVNVDINLLNIHVFCYKYKLIWLLQKLLYKYLVFLCKFITQSIHLQQHFKETLRIDQFRDNVCSNRWNQDWNCMAKMTI